MAPRNSTNQVDKRTVLRIGDVLKEPLYGRLGSATAPVLLMAAGRRIETEQQLLRLRAAGFVVELPGDSHLALTPDIAEASIAVGAPALRLQQPLAALQPEFSGRLTAANQMHQAVTGAARELMGRVRFGSAPDLAVLEQASSALLDAVIADSEAFAALTYLRLCDDYTVEHSVDVAILMVAIAWMLEVPTAELRVMALAGLAHDIGKQRVPVDILSKPGTLTREEFALIQRHPQYGFDLLAACPDCPESVRLVALQHHERLDGSGYPEGLTVDQHHPYSRIAAVADTFDAMTADRVYHRGCLPRQALLELYRDQDKRLDPAAIQALIRLMGVYPVGTRVLLSTGERGVVVAPNPTDTTRPVVMVDHDDLGRPLATSFVLSLQSAKCRIVGA